jgi:PKD repeat protein
VFYDDLSCKGRTYRHASRVPYQITLIVRVVTSVDGIRFARAITASYTNSQRSDATRCPLGPSHDAALYLGPAISPVPSPPTASFSAVINRASDLASFTSTSLSGVAGAAIVSRRWQFGDRASGGADTSTLATPQHQFSAPGAYVVSLTVGDTNGLSATRSQVVTAPGPPTASFTATQPVSSPRVFFQDDSTPGFGAAPIVGWDWDFGDPSSGARNTSAAPDPTHTFGAAGSYTVTLTVTDANGFTASTARELVSPP